MQAQIYKHLDVYVVESIDVGKNIKLLFCFVSLAKKTFLGQNKSFWGPLELVEKLVPEAAEITASVKDLPGLK